MIVTGLMRAISFLLLIGIHGTAIASPAALTYQGRIITQGGTPLEHSSVSFQFEILNPSGTCVIYREQVDGINMKNSGGVFDVKIGASHTYPGNAGFSILDSFNNSGSFVCDGGVAYNPTSIDGRLLRVQYGLVVRDGANTNVFWTRDDGAIYAQERMGIAASPDTNYALRMAGNLYVGGSVANCTLGTAAGGVSCTSDARLKENVVVIPDSLEKILALRGVEFDWNQASGKNGQHAVGVIAQEVEKQFPTLVHEEKTSGYRTVDYAGLVAPIIESIKSLYAKIISTDDRVAKLEVENKILQEKVEAQSRGLASVKTEMQEELSKEKQRNDLLEQRLKALEEKIK
jgi:hypothetical protein